MDLADLADQQNQIALDAALDAARQVQHQEADHCADCGAELLPHRVEYGCCVECQRAREAVQRLRAVGV